MSCGIYKITNKINNKCYIGKAINIKRRWIEHRYMAQNSDCNYALYRAIRKYGLENFSFEIIEECPEDNHTLFEKEQYWIEYYNSFKDGYNETLGGEGAFKYKPSEIQELWDQGLCSKEIQKKLGCGNKTIHKALDGYKDYTIEASQLRSSKSEEKRKQHSKLALEKWSTGPVYQYNLNGEFLKEHISISEAAKSLGKEHDRSISKALNLDDRSNMAYGFLWSRDKKDKIPPYIPTNSTQVKNIETGQIFNSFRKAATWAGCVHSTIKNACLKGTQAGKHPETGEPLHWEYYIPL